MLSRLTPAALQQQHAHATTAAGALALALLPFQVVMYIVVSAAVSFWQAATVAAFLVPPGARLAAAASVIVLLAFAFSNGALSLPIAIGLLLATLLVSALPTLATLRVCAPRGEAEQRSTSGCARFALRLWRAWWRVSNHVSPGAAIALVVAVAALVAALHSEQQREAASSHELRLISLVTLALLAIPALEALQVQQHRRQLALERHSTARATTLTPGAHGHALPFSALRQRLWTLRSWDTYQRCSAALGHRNLGGTVLTGLQLALSVQKWLSAQRATRTRAVAAVAATANVAAVACALPAWLLRFLSAEDVYEHRLGNRNAHRAVDHLALGLTWAATACVAIYLAAHMPCFGVKREKLYASGSSEDTVSKVKTHENALFDSTRILAHAASSGDTVTGQRQAETSPVAVAEGAEDRSTVSTLSLPSDCGGATTRVAAQDHPLQVSVRNTDRSASDKPSTPGGAMQDEPHQASEFAAASPSNIVAASGTSPGGAAKQQPAAPHWQVSGGLSAEQAATAAIALAAPNGLVDALLEWDGTVDERLMAFFSGIRVLSRAPLLQAAQRADGLDTEHIALATAQRRAEWGKADGDPEAAERLGPCATKVRSPARCPNVSGTGHSAAG